LVLVLLLGAGVGLGQVSIPDTAAGHALRAWLEAFNSGDRAKAEAYFKAFDPSGSADMMMVFHNQTGGFELLGIESTEPLLIRFRVKEKASPTVAVGTIQVKDGQPVVVESLGIRAIPPGVVIEDVKVDAGERRRVIDGVIANLNEFYVYPETAKKMGEAVEAHEKHGDYDPITDGSVFASRLTKDLRDVSHDKHLNVIYNPFKQPADQHGPSAEDDARWRKQMDQINCGFERVEVLPHNVGYLKFNMFADPDVCGATAVAAMNFLAHVDAIIFDLRENGGGDPAMIALISTYLFDESTHLNDLYTRKDDSTAQYWTLPFVPGGRLAGKPAFVLTSHTTFSGAEEFSYNLKNLKRATIVGETTGGGAHPVGGHRIDDHFRVDVPFARAVNPVSKTNWEGTGVEPDIPVKAADALDTAEKLAAEKLRAN
jgi:hypothetical protein